MPKLVWDQIGEKFYETGIEQVALYLYKDGGYNAGVAWNGITALNVNPSGAEPTALYANNTKYLTLMSAEEVGGTIEAYTYPVEWRKCMGFAEIVKGAYVGQQNRSTFGIVGKSIIGNDTELDKYGYKLHLIWGALASPSEEGHSTVNESPEATTFSWEFSTTPVPMTGFKPTSYLCIESNNVDAEKLKALEAVLYGSDEAEASLPMPSEVATILGWTDTTEPAEPTNPDGEEQ